MSKAKTYWLALMQELAVPDQAARRAWHFIEAAYREPHRRYHTLKHIGHFLDQLHRFANGQPSAAQRLAVFFHDIVYDGKAHDNEERSALLAEAFLNNNGLEALCAPVGHLIRATASHRAAGVITTPGLSTDELLLFLDCDLLILAASPRAYRTYTRGVALEYGHLSEAVFAQGRTVFLKTFLGPEPIFRSRAVAAQAEEAARRNLRNELKSLSRALRL